MPTAITEIALVAAGGIIGCLGRYGMVHISWFNGGVYATMVTNIIGCLAIGIAWALIQHFGAQVWSSRFVITGLLGGFTTFSSFTLHPILMMREGLMMQALAYIIITLIGGLLACAAGLYLTERLIH